ncbi:MAG: aminodeoxychorismate synthase component I [Desulfobacterales bacterium]|nr:aminodeoxychorismate synthase component I [Desulfobacterales bacterium]
MFPGPVGERSLAALFAALDNEERFALFETTRISGPEHRTLLFRRPVDCLTCRSGDDVREFFTRAEEMLAQGYYLAGWFAYEFGYLLEPALAAAAWDHGDGDRVLAELGVYNGPHVLDNVSGEFSGAGPWPATEPDLTADCSFSVTNLGPTQEQQTYLERIRTIKEYIAAGDTYQVNYTIKLCFDFAGSAAALYRSLRRNQSVSYGAYLKGGEQRILSFSPELFFRKQGGTLTVRPMKGTVRRGRTIDEDAEMRRFLREDIKNRSENVMIVDLLRNDLGRLSPVGGGNGVRVRSLFEVETYETLHQMTSTVEATVAPELPLKQMFEALFPCGSVTGAPKIRTMEIIRELESGPRGVYTGAVGYITPDRDAVFNVPIRTLVINGSQGEMGIGSGIVWDSDPPREWEECCLKGDFLTRPLPEFQLIETLLWRPGSGYWLLDLHLERLTASAEYLGFYLELEKVCKELQGAAEGFVNQGAGRQRVRLTLAKDGGVTITSSRLTPANAEPLAGGDLPRVCFSEEPVHSTSPYLYHKTTRRGFYEQELKKAIAAGCFEVLFVNQRDQVTEGSFTNLFIEKDGFFLTPPVSAGLLNGVFRRHFLADKPEKVREAILYRQDLEQADAIYVANSVRGLVRVVLNHKCRMQNEES